jgi:hypothetical protein
MWMEGTKRHGSPLTFHDLMSSVPSTGRGDDADAAIYQVSLKV